MADLVPQGDSRDGKAGAPALLEAVKLARSLKLRKAGNGVQYASFGDMRLETAELERIIAAVPAAAVPALAGHAFYFVPLALAPERKGGASDTLIAETYSAELADDAICHRDVRVRANGTTPEHEGTFISARLLRDTFALAFEFFINVAHDVADQAGVPEAAAELFWSQALAGVRGETSQDASEARLEALPQSAAPASDRPGPTPKITLAERPGNSGTPNEKARLDFLHAAFADALAIYMLSLAVDFDYTELREREYALLAPSALAERLRLMAKLFPPNAGYEFSIRYRRR